MKYSMTGLVRAGAKTSRYLKRVRRVTSEVMDELANDIMVEAQRQTPVDTGQLRDSARIHGATPFRRIISFEAIDPVSGYSYGPIQHENLEFKHEIGNAKFLENSVNSNLVKLSERFKVIVEEW